MLTDYEKIEQAILFLKNSFREQPDLETVAEQVHLSPFHFQRLFKDWAGVSPKKFLQFLSIEYAKSLLDKNVNLADASFQTGLSGTSRLHDLFISIEGMTPGEYKSQGGGLTIHYSFAETLFGRVAIASTPKGICFLSFVEDEDNGWQQMQASFPRATFIPQTDALQQEALRLFSKDWSDLQSIKLHLKGTAFQLKVWQSLLQIPMGGVTTYGQIAGQLSQPGASRAVGTAVGNNPVAFLIPCHRVIRSSGATGEYHWGSGRKTALLGWEAAQLQQEKYLPSPARDQSR